MFNIEKCKPPVTKYYMRYFFFSPVVKINNKIIKLPQRMQRGTAGAYNKLAEQGEAASPTSL